MGSWSAEQHATERAELTDTEIFQRAAATFELREANVEERIIAGTIVPYGETITRQGFFENWRERFEPGAFDESGDDVMLFYGHSDPIGLVVDQDDRDAGRYASFRVSKTPRGDEVMTLVRDKVLRKFSVGFYPVEHRVETDKDGVETIVRTKVDLREVSVVPIPAYAGAAIDEVRHRAGRGTTPSEREQKMDPEIETDPAVSDLRSDVAQLSRRFDVLASGSGRPAEPAVRWSSGGEFLKALQSRNFSLEDVEILNRAFTGATTDDSDGDRTAWIAGEVKLVAENRPILDLFSKGTLPSEGMTLTYPQLQSATGTVGMQVLEGDDLPYMEVLIGDASVPVRTYGGYSSLSRQAIERSTIQYLDTVRRYQVLQYAKATNLAAVAAFISAVGVQTAPALTDWDIMGVVETMLDASAMITDNALGAAAEFGVVAGDVFRAIATIPNSDGEPYFPVLGTGNGRYLSVAGLTIKENRRLAGGTFRIGSSEAITVYEQAGAPFKLEDDNIINLTKDYSLYGYMAVGRTNPAAMVDVPNPL